MMFSDVAGFTSVSEMLDPHFLANLMNRYLSPMTEIIVKQDGYVTLYMGDGIMAVWGVLSPDQDQEYHACVAAVRKVEMATQISEVLPDGRLWTFSIRIGLNTGVVSAGNLGSVQKSQYTVMGDDVNLTARLEPTNKDYGTKIIMGPQTFNAVRERVWARPLDKLVVKGKSEGVLIYELIGLREDDPIGPGEWPLLYEKALHHFWAQEWDAAEALFEQVQTMKIGGDKASDMQLKKVRYYRLNPLEFTEATIRKEKD
jgi:adenylate cyclase